MNGTIRTTIRNRQDESVGKGKERPTWNMNQKREDEWKNR
jgi:hypothetical protein